jgi:SPP1 gp7 family putative phage head morphogenesis protein
MWGAHQVDGRISAKNAVKIRAALRQSIDARQVYEMYQATSPAVSDNNAQDRARARAWAIMNVRFINEALRTALMRLFAEAWVTGQAAADEAIYEEEALRKAGEIGVIDWSKWQPGDKATALLLEPTGAFKRILDRTGTTITGLDKTGYELVGTALADSIRAGYSPKKAAKLIQDAVGSPARALTIAVTESSRVMNSAAIDRYQEAGIDTMQWSAVAGGGTSVACDVCAQNAGEKRKIGQPFSTGKTQPPQHPHCRCNLRPVVPDYDDMFDAQGNLLPLKPNNNGVSDIMPSEPDLIIDNASRRFIAGQDEEIYAALKQDQGAYINTLSKEQLKAVAGYQAEGTYDEVNNYLRGKSKKISAENKKLIKTLDDVIDGTSLEYNTTVYRGISDDTGDFMNLKIGDTITEKGYSSTSPNPAVAEAFANSTVIEGKPVVLEIELPYGQPAIASDVASNRLFGVDMVEEDEMMIEITGFTRLNEVTLPRDMTLEVTEIIDKENARYVKARPKK